MTWHIHSTDNEPAARPGCAIIRSNGHLYFPKKVLEKLEVSMEQATHHILCYEESTNRIGVRFFKDEDANATGYPLRTSLKEPSGVNVPINLLLRDRGLKMRRAVVELGMEDGLIVTGPMERQSLTESPEYK